MTDEPDKKPRVKLLDGAAGEAAAKLTAERQSSTRLNLDDDEYYQEARARREQYRPAQPEPTPRYEQQRVGQANFPGFHYFSVVLPGTVKLNANTIYGKEIVTQVAITAHANEESLLDLAKTLQAIELQVREALALARKRKDDKPNPEPEKEPTK